MDAPTPPPETSSGQFRPRGRSLSPPRSRPFRGRALSRRILQGAALAVFLFLFFRGLGSMEVREAVSGGGTGVEGFVRLDPLAALSAAAASRAWTDALWWTIPVLLVSLLAPRWFCGYFCPLGTVLDLAHAAGRVFRREAVPVRPLSTSGLRHYLLAAVAGSAVAGTGLLGGLAALPLLSRGLAGAAAAAGKWAGDGLPGAVSLGWSAWGGMLLLGLALATALLPERFWCRHLCPTGALFSLFGAFRLAERTVTEACSGCGRCAEVCPLGAVREDFSPRHSECSFCGECAEACPEEAIGFGWRRFRAGTGRAAESPGGGTETAGRGAPLPDPPDRARRGFLAAGAGLLGLGLGLPLRRADRRTEPPVRPPGSLPEEEFLARCVRCWECVAACPTGILRPAGTEGGTSGLWTPLADGNEAGCAPWCNRCGWACPTGAVRALPLPEKRAARMGLAEVDETACLPYTGRAECTLCREQCEEAGYGAVELVRVRVELDEAGRPVENSGFLAPVILPDKCVGCCLCQSRCHQVNVVSRGVLKEAAVKVRAGEGLEDRLREGSYLRLREGRCGAEPPHEERPPSRDEYLPGFLR